MARLLFAALLVAAAQGALRAEIRGESTTNITLGSIQTQIEQAASKYWGTNTASGPGGGVEACAWAVNNVMSNAGLRKIGSNPNLVSSVVDALKSGRGHQVSEADTLPGDLAVACGAQHIGIIMAKGGALCFSNSSSQKCYCWKSNGNFDGYFSCGGSTFYRVDN